jgi:hypothetical protein
MRSERFWSRRWSRRDGVPAGARRVAETRLTIAASEAAWLLASGQWRSPAPSRRRSPSLRPHCRHPWRACCRRRSPADRGPCARFFDCAVRGKRQREVAAGILRRSRAAPPVCPSSRSAQAGRNSRPRQPGRRRGSRGRPLAMPSLIRVGIAPSRARPFANRRARRAPAQTARIPKRRDLALDAEEATGRQTLRAPILHIRVVLATRPPEVGPGPPGTWTASRGGR